MKEITTETLRNVALVSHGGAGKTSLAEAMLFLGKSTDRLGKVDVGTTILDTDIDEIERQMTINLGISYLIWKNTKINLLDTPGYLDFIGEVISGLSISDSALLLIDAQAGIEVGTEKNWEYLNKFNLPRMIVINKMNRENSDFDKVINMINELLNDKGKPIVLQLPIGKGEDFKGVVDLLKMKAYTYDMTSENGIPNEIDIPDELTELAENAHTELVENIAETDDALMEKYFEEGDLSNEEITKALKKGTQNGNLVPILVTCGLHNMAIDTLLDAIVEFLPSPAECETFKGITQEDEEPEDLPIDPSAKLASKVFKVTTEQHVGELSYFRVYSGTLEASSEIYNITRSSSERIGQIYQFCGKDRKSVGKVIAGDIGSLVKLKHTKIGDTLTEKNKPIIIPIPEYPKPVIAVAIESIKKGDEDKIGQGFNKIAEEDPTFAFIIDGEMKQTLISGMGEMHLEVASSKLKHKFNVNVEMIKPKIPYRETVKGKSEVQHKYKKQSGGRGQYGDVHIRMAPLSSGEGFEFVNKIVGGVIPIKYIPAVEKGIIEAMHTGILAGYPVVDVQVTLFYGSYHSVDSSDMAFKIAGSMAFRKAMQQAKPIILEPIYDIEVTVPDEYLGDVMGDISSKRGKIQGVSAKGYLQIVSAKVPQAELYKYSTNLRSLTQGRGFYTQSFSHYDQVPHEETDKIIEEAKKAKEEE